MNGEPGWKPQPLDEPQGLSTWGFIKAVLSALVSWLQGQKIEAARRREEVINREREQDERLQASLHLMDAMSGPELDAELERVLRVEDEPKEGTSTSNPKTVDNSE